MAIESKFLFCFVFILDFKEVLLFFLLRFKTITRNPYFAPNKTTTRKSFEQKRTLIVDQIKSINKKKKETNSGSQIIINCCCCSNFFGYLIHDHYYYRQTRIYIVCFQAIFCQYFSLTHCF